MNKFRKISNLIKILRLTMNVNIFNKPKKQAIWLLKNQKINISLVF